jgi:hypothetical protein
MVDSPFGNGPPLSYPTSTLVAVAVLSDLLAQLDPDPYRRGRQFERICQWMGRLPWTRWLCTRAAHRHHETRCTTTPSVTIRR